MKKTFTLLLVAFGWSATAQNSSTFALQSQIYITHTTVIDTDTGKEATDQTVVISDGKIADVAKTKNLAAPASARIVDGRGKYLIPGLWDMHVHTWDYESTYPLYIANGVTGVRDMFGPPEANKFRAELDKKQLIAPHFYLASPIVDGHPPVWKQSIEVTSSEQGRKVVDDQQQKGADFIKVYSRLTPDAYFAIAAESARVGIPFEGHVPNQVSAWKASDARQKSFEHLYGIAIACSTREEELQAKMLQTTTMKERQLLAAAGAQSYSESKCNRLFTRLKSNSNWQVPTLTVLRPKNWSDPQLSQDPRLHYFSGEYRDWLTAKHDSQLKGWISEDLALEKQQFEFDKKLVGAMFRAGVPLLAGTDTGNPYCFPGFSLHDELALLVESGLTPLAALQAATRNAATFMNAADRYGSISRGKIADLVLLDADPLQDVRNTTKISAVFLAGREFDRTSLDGLLKSAEEQANKEQQRAAGQSSTSATQSNDDPASFPGQTKGDFIIKDFRFNSEEVLPELRLHYVTIGTPQRNASGEIDNAVLLLHSTGGDTTEFFEPSLSGPLYGPGEPLDLDKFYLIIPDDVGHGKSSKPSDGLRTHFPRYGYNDMVTAQYRLVTEKLGIAHLRMVLGLSMGAMHTWLWGERYPEMMDGLFPISGLPAEIGGRNRLWRHMIVEAIRNDPKWKNEDYDQKQHAALRLAPLVAIMTGNPVKQFEKYPTKAAADAWYDSILKRVFEHRNATNAVYYYDASSDYNPGPDLEKIKAKLFLIVFDDDQINSPEFAVLDREMPRVKNGKYVVVHTGKEGNGEAEDNINAKLWQSHLQEFLQSLNK